MWNGKRITAKMPKEFQTEVCIQYLVVIATLSLGTSGPMEFLSEI